MTDGQVAGAPTRRRPPCRAGRRTRHATGCSRGRGPPGPRRGGPRRRWSRCAGRSRRTGPRARSTGGTAAAGWARAGALGGGRFGLGRRGGHRLPPVGVAAREGTPRRCRPDFPALRGPVYRDGPTERSRQERAATASVSAANIRSTSAVGGVVGVDRAVEVEGLLEVQLGALDDDHLDPLERLAQGRPRVLRSAPAVSDAGDRHAVPLGVEVVDGVLQRRVVAAVVLGHDEDDGVERLDERGPAAGVLVGVVALGRHLGLVEQREGELAQVDRDELDVLRGQPRTQAATWWPIRFGRVLAVTMPMRGRLIRRSNRHGSRPRASSRGRARGWVEVKGDPLVVGFHLERDGRGRGHG